MYSKVQCYEILVTNIFTLIRLVIPEMGSGHLLGQTIRPLSSGSGQPSFITREITKPLTLASSVDWLVMFWANYQLLPAECRLYVHLELSCVMCHVSCVMCHVSCVMCHVSCVMRHWSCVMCNVAIPLCFYT